MSRKQGADDYVAAKGVRALDALPSKFASEEPPTAEKTDIGNAERLAHRAAGLFLYVPPWNAWMAWDGRRWARDDTGAIRALAIEVAKDILLEARQEADETESKALAKHAYKSQSAERVAAMLKLAPDTRADLRAMPAAFDADPWSFNVNNGTLDLRTGKLRPHSPTDRITQLAPVEYEPRAKCPLWDKTLREILPQVEVREFLKRWLGYSLTGDVREEKLAFLMGSGRNGKGTIVETVLSAVGSYACVTPEQLLLARKFDAHPTELADLYGKRLIVANEIGEGRTWNAPRVKALTGGDRVKARRMHEDFWEFSPTHKITVLTNQRPRASADDHALWARFKVVPFEQSFEAKPNTALKQELRKKALHAVLAWLVEGCLEWQKRGLGEPALVRAATAEYRDEQRDLDPINHFLKQTRSYPVSLKALTEAYNDHVLEPGGRGRRLTSKELAAKLKDRGYVVRPGAKNITFLWPPRGTPTRAANVVALPKTGTKF